MLCPGVLLAVAFGLDLRAADPAQDGPRVPTQTGLSALGRRWSRVEKKDDMYRDPLRLKHDDSC